MGRYYSTVAPGFPGTVAQMSKAQLFTSPACKKEFIDVYCQLMRGSICSTDMKLRMFATSEQDCTSKLKKW